MPASRNTKLTIFDITTLLLSRKMADFANPNVIKKCHFVPESDVYETYTGVISKVHSLLWGSSAPCQFSEMLLFSLAEPYIYDDVCSFISKRRLFSRTT